MLANGSATCDIRINGVNKQASRALVFVKIMTMLGYIMAHGRDPSSRGHPPEQSLGVWQGGMVLHGGL